MNKPSVTAVAPPAAPLLSLLLLMLLIPAVAPAQETKPASNASPATATSEPLRWLSLTNQELQVCGLPWFKENGGQLLRLPLRSKSSFRPAVWNLANSPSGARIRLRSDTKLLSIRLEYPSAPNMANMHAFGQTGVDLYSDGEYLATAVADKEAQPGKTYEKVLFDFSKQPRATRDLVLYLSLYKPVKVLGIGVDPEAKLEAPKPFVTAKPVVFYGTSITQGGAASRPGMSYQAQLCRRLNLDFVNLGFSGNGLGEPAVAAAVAEIDASCFVLDFGANHHTCADMAKVYAPFLDAVRAKHPHTPILAITLNYNAVEARDAALKRDREQKREHIRQVVQQRIQAGDSRLYLVEGTDLLGRAQADGLVDGSHPNDLGFFWMANGLSAPLRKALALP
jgi:hypothetical protein